jgi:hypothetical protein
VALYRDRLEALWRLGAAGDALVVLVRKMAAGWTGSATGSQPAPERVELTDADRCSGDPEAASYRSVSRPRVIRPRPPSPSDERPEWPELDGPRVNTLTGAEFTVTPGIPGLPMGGWLSPDGAFWPCSDAEGLPCRIDEHDYTQAQLDTVFDLAMRHEPMRRRLMRELARVGAGMDEAASGTAHHRHEVRSVKWPARARSLPCDERSSSRSGRTTPDHRW